VRECAHASRPFMIGGALVVIISPGVPVTALILVKSEGICVLW
jgi:hypothetical protein